MKINTKTLILILVMIITTAYITNSLHDNSDYLHRISELENKNIIIKKQKDSIIKNIEVLEKDLIIKEKVIQYKDSIIDDLSIEIIDKEQDITDAQKILNDNILRNKAIMKEIDDIRNSAGKKTEDELVKSLLEKYN